MKDLEVTVGRQVLTEAEQTLFEGTPIVRHILNTTGGLAVLLAMATMSHAVAAPKMNEPPSGFVRLFNGYDLHGWKGLVGDPKTRAEMSATQLAAAQKKADEDMRLHWKLEDGVIVFDGRGGSLCTTKEYRNFILLVDFKIEKEGDSGIYLRGSPQVQIWDPQLNNIGSGGLYNNKKNPSKPLVLADNPVGQWNTFRIQMIGPRVTVWLNEKLVVDNVEMENYWEPEKPIYSAGQIELQNHGNSLYFRNIFLKEIP